MNKIILFNLILIIDLYIHIRNSTCTYKVKVRKINIFNALLSYTLFQIMKKIYPAKNCSLY